MTNRPTEVGRSASRRAVRSSTQAPAGLGHTATIPSADGLKDLFRILDEEKRNPDPRLDWEK